MEPTSLIGQAARSMNIPGNPAMNQVSATAPTAQPGMMPPAPTPMPDKSPASEIKKTPLHGAFERRGMPVPGQLQSPPSTPLADPSQQGANMPVSEAELILKALSSRLGMIGKHESAVRDHLFPPQPTPSTPISGGQ